MHALRQAVLYHKRFKRLVGCQQFERAGETVLGHTQVSCCSCGRIEVDDQAAITAKSQGGRHMNANRRLAYTAFLIPDSNKDSAW